MRAALVPTTRDALASNILSEGDDRAGAELTGAVGRRPRAATTSPTGRFAEARGTQPCTSARKPPPWRRRTGATV